MNTNVCGVDWSDLANQNYFQAALINTHIAGRVVANFLNFISYALGIPAANVTIAGHSLGAHVAGFVGKDLKRFSNQQLGYIIGLDPAGPLFTFPLLAPPENILTADDAAFVQVLHTSVFTFGAYNRLGNADFYANNAIIQPGCFAPLNPGTLRFGRLHKNISFFNSKHFCAVRFSSVFVQSLSSHGLFPGFTQRYEPVPWNDLCDGESRHPGFVGHSAFNVCSSAVRFIWYLFASSSGTISFGNHRQLSVLHWMHSLNVIYL